MNKSTKQKYNKHHVKRDPQTLSFIVKDGEPQVGDYIRDVTLPDEIVEELNINSLNSGYIWVKAEKDVNINLLPVAQLKEMCKENGLDDNGTKAELLKRLKEKE